MSLQHVRLIHQAASDAADDRARSGPRQFYDAAYLTANYFAHREWLYRPYIRSLIAATGLRKGSEVLDAGCGQGFFSRLFAEEGMVVYATDMSIVGVQTATAHFSHKGIRFFVSDLTQAPTTHQFDCVFVRSCSLYNRRDLSGCVVVTTSLLTMLKPGGLFIFAYNTNLSGASNGWRHHPLDDVRQCLGAASSAVDLYFINKLDTLLLRRHAFNRVVTMINKSISRRTSVGGEAVAVFRKQAVDSHIEPSLSGNLCGV